VRRTHGNMQQHCWQYCKVKRFAHRLKPSLSIELWFYCTSHSRQNRSLRRRFPSQSLGLGVGKLNLTQQKHTFTNQKKCTTTQNKHQKVKPGLVISYNIRSANAESLFPILVSALYKFVTSATYIVTYWLSYSPGTHMGHHLCLCTILSTCTPSAL